MMKIKLLLVSMFFCFTLLVNINTVCASEDTDPVLAKYEKLGKVFSGTFDGISKDGLTFYDRSFGFSPNIKFFSSNGNELSEWTYDLKARAFFVVNKDRKVIMIKKR